jgi:hypothetical protein
VALAFEAWTMPEKTESTSSVERDEQKNDKAREMLWGRKIYRRGKCPD